jgi:hypothetical protein
MHPQSTRNEFLRLRVQGLSLAGIGRRLNISKPTAIKWNRQCQSEIAAAAGIDRQCVQQEVAASIADEIAALTRRLTAIKQELFSRALHEIPTAALETFAGELRQRLESLQPGTNGAAPPTAVSSNGDGESTNPSVHPASSIQYPVSSIRAHPNLIEHQKNIFA